MQVRLYPYQYPGMQNSLSAILALLCSRGIEPLNLPLKRKIAHLCAISIPSRS